jgi:hypothetical protein
MTVEYSETRDQDLKRIKELIQAVKEDPKVFINLLVNLIPNIR